MKIFEMSNYKNTEMNKFWTESAEKNHFWIIWRFKFLIKELIEKKIYLSKKLKIMDLGCGNGILSNQIETYRPVKIDRVDSSKQMLKKNKKVKGKLICYNISRKNKILKNKYDIVFLFDVLEHIKNDKKFLLDVLYHIKPGGFLVLNVPSLQLFYSKYDVAVGHVRRYSKATFSKTSKIHGANMVSIKYWGFLLVPVLALRKFSLILYNQKKYDSIVKHGWKTNSMINYLMKIIMKIELGLFRNFIIGTSLMTIIQKK